MFIEQSQNERNISASVYDLVMSRSPSQGSEPLCTGHRHTFQWYVHFNLMHSSWVRYFAINYIFSQFASLWLAITFELYFIESCWADYHISNIVFFFFFTFKGNPNKEIRCWQNGMKFCTLKKNTFWRTIICEKCTDQSIWPIWVTDSLIRLTKVTQNDVKSHMIVSNL